MHPSGDVQETRLDLLSWGPVQCLTPPPGVTTASVRYAWQHRPVLFSLSNGCCPVGWPGVLLCVIPHIILIARLVCLHRVTLLPTDHSSLALWRWMQLLFLPSSLCTVCWKNINICETSWNPYCAFCVCDDAECISLGCVGDWRLSFPSLLCSGFCYAPRSLLLDEVC